MKPPVRLAMLLPAGLLLAGCAYDPPMRTDHAAPQYRDALARCRKDIDTAASRKANATPSSAIAALSASDEPQRRGIQACLEKRGYSAL